MSKTHAVKYSGQAPKSQRAPHPPYLVLVSSVPAEGIGAEALEVKRQLEEWNSRINETETLTRALLARVDEEGAPQTYNHVQGTQVATLKVRYRNLGRLPPREVPFDDE